VSFCHRVNAGVYVKLGQHLAQLDYILPRQYTQVLVMAYRVMAYMVMAYVVMAYMIMAYMVKAYVVMAHMVKAYVVMTYMSQLDYILLRQYTQVWDTQASTCVWTCVDVCMDMCIDMCMEPFFYRFQDKNVDMCKGMSLATFCHECHNHTSHFLCTGRTHFHRV